MNCHIECNTTDGTSATAQAVNQNVIPLTLSRYLFIFTPITQGTLPGYSGSTWRGAFGHGLKKSSCLNPGKACQQCLLQHNCAYSYLFESAPPSDSDRMRLYPTVPAPYILEPLEVFGSSESSSNNYPLGLTLFGRANDFLPHVIQGMILMAQNGIGKGRAPTQLLEIKKEAELGSGNWQTLYRPEQPSPPTIRPSLAVIPPINQNISLKLLTPMRLRREEKYISPETFHFSDLFSNLLRRISTLSYFHNQQELQTDFKALSQAARNIQLQDQQLTWWDWQRYSSRQNNKIKMGGIVGTLQLPAEQLAPFWPYLWLGQWTHAGKGTSMGLGKYQIKTATNQ